MAKADSERRNKRKDKKRDKKKHPYKKGGWQRVMGIGDLRKDDEDNKKAKKKK
jgi:hypothetical protein